MAKASRVEDEDAAGAAMDLSRAVGELSLPALKARIRARLDPVDGSAAGTACGSDVDLNPHLMVPLAGLQPAAVLIALIERPEGLAVLFTQRADQLRRHAGQIAFPGGRCDPGETPAESALREAQEEVGLDPALVALAGLSTPYRTLTGYHITPVVGFAPPALALTLSPAEVADAFEVPFAFLMDPANHERRHRDQPPGPPRWHYAITWQGRLIWGATAGMVRALYERLSGPDPGRDAGA
jgi:8-oxo-dGTP pyrophosphatase MutT (NUDIX family)